MTKLLEALVVHQTPAEAKWSRIIERQQQSGQTVAAFAAEQGINRNTLSWWKWNLTRGREPQTSSPFVEIPVPTSTDPTVILALDHFPAHVVVDRDTDLALLRALLEALC